MAPPAPLGSRVGILGGTFDPVHVGHLAVAAAATARFALDTVLFIPAASPPHKLHAPLAPFADRVAMLRLALAGHADYAISEMERARPGPSFSIDTLKELRQQMGEEVRLFFCIGLDAFRDLPSWKEYGELFRHAEFVVAERPESGGTGLGDFIAGVVPNFQRAGEGEWVEAGGAGRIHALAMPEVPVSSSRIRQRLAQGESIAGLVEEAVAAYIADHGLYQGAGSRG